MKFLGKAENELWGKFFYLQFGSKYDHLCHAHIIMRSRIWFKLSDRGATPPHMTRKVVQNTRPSFSHVRGGAGHETNHYSGRTGRGGTTMWTIMNFTRLPYNKLFLKRKEQATSSFHLGRKNYLQITWKAAKSVGAVGNRRENRHRFKVLVSYKCSYASMASNKYLVVVSHLDKLVQPSYTLCTQISPLATLEAS